MRLPAEQEGEEGSGKRSDPDPLLRRDSGAERNGCYHGLDPSADQSDLADVTADQVKGMVIAYEPIWAIGTGKTATTEQAEEVCKGIRECIAEMYDTDTAEAVRIQYGGSVNAGNAAELFAQPDIDGGLVGGASLKADFGKIVNYK